MGSRKKWQKRTFLGKRNSFYIYLYIISFTEEHPIFAAAAKYFSFTPLKKTWVKKEVKKESEHMKSCVWSRLVKNNGCMKALSKNCWKRITLRICIYEKKNLESFIFYTRFSKEVFNRFTQTHIPVKIVVKKGYGFYDELLCLRQWKRQTARQKHRCHILFVCTTKYTKPLPPTPCTKDPPEQNNLGKVNCIPHPLKTLSSFQAMAR